MLILIMLTLYIYDYLFGILEFLENNFEIVKVRSGPKIFKSLYDIWMLYD